VARFSAIRCCMSDWGFSCASWQIVLNWSHMDGAASGVGSGSRVTVHFRKEPRVDLGPRFGVELSPRVVDDELSLLVLDTCDTPSLEDPDDEGGVSGEGRPR